MKGADILQVLAEADAPLSVGQVASEVGALDGRSVRPSLTKLLGAGLVRREKEYWRPTERGVEVDQILARITAARGGTFAPWTQSGIDINERLALS